MLQPTNFLKLQCRESTLLRGPDGLKIYLDGGGNVIPLSEWPQLQSFGGHSALLGFHTKVKPTK
jgi:hypothetical protein